MVVSYRGERMIGNLPFSLLNGQKERERRRRKRKEMHYSYLLATKRWNERVKQGETQEV